MNIRISTPTCWWQHWLNEFRHSQLVSNTIKNFSTLSKREYCLTFVKQSKSFLTNYFRLISPSVLIIRFFSLAIAVNNCKNSFTLPWTNVNCFFVRRFMFRSRAFFLWKKIINVMQVDTSESSPDLEGLGRLQSCAQRLEGPNCSNKKKHIIAKIQTIIIEKLKNLK